MKAYKLNAATLTSVEAIATVLDGLGLVIRDDAPMFDALSGYFNIEVEAPAAIAGQSEQPVAQTED